MAKSTSKSYHEIHSVDWLIQNNYYQVIREKVLNNEYLLIDFTSDRYIRKFYQHFRSPTKDKLFFRSLFNNYGDQFIFNLQFESSRLLSWGPPVFYEELFIFRDKQQDLVKQQQNNSKNNKNNQYNNHDKYIPILPIILPDLLKLFLSSNNIETEMFLTYKYPEYQKYFNIKLLEKAYLVDTDVFKSVLHYLMDVVKPTTEQFKSIKTTFYYPTITIEEMKYLYNYDILDLENTFKLIINFGFRNIKKLTGREIVDQVQLLHQFNTLTGYRDEDIKIKKLDSALRDVISIGLTTEDYKQTLETTSKDNTRFGQLWKLIIGIFTVNEEDLMFYSVKFNDMEEIKERMTNRIVDHRNIIKLMNMELLQFLTTMNISYDIDYFYFDQIIASTLTLKQKKDFLEYLWSNHYLWNEQSSTAKHIFEAVICLGDLELIRFSFQLWQKTAIKTQKVYYEPKSLEVLRYLESVDIIKRECFSKPTDLDYDILYYILGNNDYRTDEITWNFYRTLYRDLLFHQLKYCWDNHCYTDYQKSFTKKNCSNIFLTTSIKYIDRPGVKAMGKDGSIETILMFINTYFPTLEHKARRRELLTALLKGVLRGNNLHIIKILQQRFPHIFNSTTNNFNSEGILVRSDLTSSILKLLKNPPFFKYMMNSFPCLRPTNQEIIDASNLDTQILLFIVTSFPSVVLDKSQKQYLKHYGYNMLFKKK